MSYEGIIILGSPRSGTTLLRRILDAHPDIACPGETNVFSSCARFLHSETISEGVDIGVLSGLQFAGFAESVVLERLRELAFGFFREHAKQRGKSQWASKTAFDLFYLDAIEKLCGRHARFLCIQRHGLDVACSIKELCDTNGTYLSEVHDYVKRHPRPLEAFCHAWVDLNRAMLAFTQRHPENTMILRYEDLVADPESALRRIANFAGVAWNDQWLGKALARPSEIGLGDWKTYTKRTVDSESVGRWKSLSPHTVGFMARVCNPMLEACGYPPVPVEPERSPEEARRRYELGLRIKSGLRSRKQET
jgi:protein-tyrosine sulfotransferase